MPMIKRQITIRSHGYEVEVGIRDEYGNWMVFVLDEAQRSQFLEKLRSDVQNKEFGAPP